MSSHPPSESPLGLAGDSPESDELLVACHDDTPNEPRNFVFLVLHQVLLRVGWVFKTESTVMHYFLDMVGGTPLQRGLLMVLNRFGFAVPPVLFARTLKLMPQKRWAAVATTLGMAVTFALLSGLWWTDAWRRPDGKAHAWVPYVFLVAYGVFFVITGLNQLAAHSLQGKLIREDLRGRLFSAVTLLGAPLAIAATWLLMPSWLAMEGAHGFVWLFAASAFFFLLASVAMLGVVERDDNFDEPRAAPWRRLHEAWKIATSPGPCRGIAVVAMLYSTHFMLFPHYQSLARESLGSTFEPRSLVLWTVAQHAAVAVLSLVAGPIADRFGNRLAVQLTVFGSALGPLTALGLALGPAPIEGDPFWLVFVSLGFTPVTTRMVINYTLELVDREEHPRHVAAVGVCLAMPVIVGSPLLGWAIGLVGLVPVFALGAGVMLVAGAQTLLLQEPRNS